MSDVTEAGRGLRVPYGQSVHGEEEIEAVVEVLRGSTQMGPRVRELEQRIARLFDKPHGLMLNSCSSANFLAVKLLDLPAGAEVVTPALTFATTVAPIVQHGLKPVFVDVEPGTYQIDVSRMRSMIGPETRALFIPSILGGLPDWDAIRAAADEHGLVVVEDSADTLGATLRGSSTGTRSDLSTTSFYGSHVINCAGNGGMLCVRDEAMYRRGKLLRSWGRSSSVFVESEAIENRFSVALDGIPYDAKFLFEEIGYNFEPSEMGAAFGLVQLRRLEENVAARRRNFDAQVAFFREWEEWLVLPRELPGTRSGWLAFPLTVRDEAPFTRRELQIHFEKNNIQTRTVFTGNVLRQPAFRGIDCRTDPQGYPCADAVTRGGIIFACHHGLAPSQIDHIHATFRRFVARYA